MSVSSTNPCAKLALSMASPMRQSGTFFVILVRKEQDKPFSFLGRCGSLQEHATYSGPQVQEECSRGVRKAYGLHLD